MHALLRLCCFVRERCVRFSSLSSLFLCSAPLVSVDRRYCLRASVISRCIKRAMKSRLCWCFLCNVQGTRETSEHHLSCSLLGELLASIRWDVIVQGLLLAVLEIFRVAFLLTALGFRDHRAVEDLLHGPAALRVGVQHATD